MSTEGTRRYELRLTLMWRALFLTAGVMALGMVVDAFETGEAFAIGTSLAFFGVGGLVLLKVVLRNSGSIELSDDGVLIDSYLTTGFLRWDQLEGVQSLRAFGVSYLGIALTDPQAYIDSRNQLDRLQHEGDRVLAGGFTRILLALLDVLPPAKTGCSMLLSVCGYPPLPRKCDEASLMAWSRQSYGVNLLIHRMWLPGFDALLNELQQGGRSNSSGQLSSSPGEGGQRRLDQSHSLDSVSKACPMCAEDVRAEARICRYCRYSFEKERLLPTYGEESTVQDDR